MKGIDALDALFGSFRVLNQFSFYVLFNAHPQYEKAQKQPSSSRWLMRSKNKRKREDGEEGAEDDVEGEQLITVDHEDEAG